MITDEIGVVAIGRNEGERLIRCLKSTRSIASSIVYVDSGSTDGSMPAAERLGAFVVALDLSQPFTAARARNAGFAALNKLNPKGRFVQFVDGDCIMTDGWLETATAFLNQKTDVAIVCGRRRERDPAASVYNRLCDLEWDTPIGETMSCGGDALMRIEAFESVAGFRPQLIAGEEPELCVRLREKGWKIWRLDAEMTQHDAAMTRFGQWWIRTVRGGYGMTEVGWLHRTSPFGIFRREAIRAVLWGGLLPLIIGFGSLLHPAVLFGCALYPLQICRIANSHGLTRSEAWTYAFFTMVAKFAELQGLLTFFWNCWRNQTVQLIEYK